MAVRRSIACLSALCSFMLCFAQSRAYDPLPDGRTITPAGHVIPVEGFASSAAMSPDGSWLAVLSQDGGAVDILSNGEDSMLVERLEAPWATCLAWTADGLYVARGYSGAVSRFRYTSAKKATEPAFEKRADLQLGGLVNGVAEDPSTHMLVVARTAAHEVDVFNDATDALVSHLSASAEPFSVGIDGTTIIATGYNSDRVDIWHGGVRTSVQTGAHPTALLMDGTDAYVADADGADVAKIDLNASHVVRRFDLALWAPSQLGVLSGQTPSGMALSLDRTELFVAESGLNDVAIVSTSSGKVLARIPTGWYPMDVEYRSSPTIDKDPRDKPQLWIVSAQGFGPQPDPGAEWDGWYNGTVQHLVIDPFLFSRWTAQVADDDKLARSDQPARSLPPIKHVVFIVQENKHFDEIFGDEPQADADPTLLLYGRHYTPNAHALAERFTLFDNFMGDGEKSDVGHSWTTQGMENDYLMRNAHTPDDPAGSGDKRVAYSIWPVAQAGEDSIPVAEMNGDWYKDLDRLPDGPRVNVSGVFGPRGELIDELQRKNVSYRVYGEEMTMQRSGDLSPGLADHADREYPGAHIDFGTLDTVRAKLFLDDVAAHGLAAYSYLTLPTNHTAGTKAGFYTPASYVASNDLALGEIVEGLSKRPDWRNTVIFVTEDDPQGTGDHVDSHRMPAFAIGPYVRRGAVDHTRYDIPSILRTVEVLFGLSPLNMHDAQATPMTAAFAATPDVRPYTALPMNVPLEKNPGKAVSLEMEIDGPDSVAIPAQEWRSIKGGRSLSLHQRRLQELGDLALDQ
jgi:DNA-binding beta-propeller fold protein YncE